MANKESIIAGAQSVVTKMQSSMFLKSLMQGMMYALPATIVGSFATLLNSIGIPAYQSFIQSTGISSLLNTAVVCANNILALIVCMGVAGAYAGRKGLKSTWGVAFSALVAFLIITPIDTATTEWGQTVYSLPFEWLGSKGMFSAITVAALTTYVFDFVVNKRKWTIKLPDSVPDMISSSFSDMIPGIVNGIVFLAIRALFAATPFGTFHSFVYGTLQTPLTGLTGNIFSLVLICIITGVLWFFGIHGGMVTVSAIAPVLMALDMENMAAVAAGTAAPNALCYAFYSIATMAGGYIGLEICLLMCKSERYKTLSKVALIPAIFGISEPLIFGTPLVMNATFAIPFIFGQAITLVSGYVLNLVGLLPNLPGVNPPMGTPFIARGLIAGGIPYALFELAMIALLVAIWMPFVRKADKDALAEEQGQGE